MKLLDHLKNGDGEQFAIFSADKSIRYSEIAEKAENYTGLLSGKKIAFHCSDVIDAVVFMASMDGFGSALILLHPEECLNITAELIKISNADIVISENVEDLKKLIRTPVFRSITDVVKTVSPGETLKSRINTDWIVSTSGTTGKPKLVEHSLYSLTRTSSKNKDKEKKQSWGLLYGFTRFAGLQVVLQSLLSGSTLIAPEISSSLKTKLSMLAKYGCTSLSATPSMWRQILMDPSGEALALKQITLGGEISDDKILAALRNRYPDAYLTHIYASTEAGVGFSVKDGRSGFPASYLSNPPNGIDIKIVDGQLWIKNDYLSSKYLGSQSHISEDGWVNTGDSVRVTSDRVYFLGRESGIINVGGNKVHPESVESVLLSHPLVENAKVYGKKNPFMGSLVVADIIVRDKDIDKKDVVKDLKEFLYIRLEPFMIPAVIKIVDNLSLNSAGKLLRK